MPDPTFLRALGLILVGAAFAALVSRPARVPTLVAYLVTGLLLGPVTGAIGSSHAIDVIAEAGIALLLFLVGLELNLAKVRDVGRVAVIAGIGQVVFTAAGGFGLAMLLGFGAIEAIFIATALTFSSTVVVVKLLNEKREIDELYGRIAVGIFLVQDLVVIVALTLLSGLSSGEQLAPAAVALGVARAFGGMLLLLGAALLAARWVLPRALGWISKAPDALLVWSLAWCFLLVLAAEAIGLSAEIGAFLAGIAIAQLPYASDLHRRVGPLTNFFIAVFFVSLGLQMEVGAATALWRPAVVLSLFVLIGNPFIFLWIIGRMGYGRRVSFLTSVTVAQISEFSFVFAAMGLAAGLIDQAVLSLIAVIGLVTIAVSAYMILYNHWLYAWFESRGLLRFFGPEEPRTLPAEPAPLPEGHVVVVGMNALGRRIVEALVRRGEEVVAIDVDPAALEGLGCRVSVGKAEHLAVLQDAGLGRAKLLVSALRIEEANRLIAHHAERLGVPTSVHAFHADAAAELASAGADHLMLPRENGTARLLELLRHEEILPR
jgi:Kef-type K+ transport system membrane component KefB